jgi:comEA protein
VRKGRGQKAKGKGQRAKGKEARVQEKGQSITKERVMVRRMWVMSGFVVTMLALAGVVGHAQRQTMAGATQAAKATAASPVNLNTATTAELETLPSIGPATAARIIEFRQKNGGFKKIEDLMNVKGIGEKSFLKLKPLVTVAPPKTSER